jgi:hypothetical protein
MNQKTDIIIISIIQVSFKYGFSIHKIGDILGGKLASFSCRDGWDGLNQPAQETINNGIELCKKLKGEHPDLEIEFDTIDEWVFVNVTVLNTFDFNNF